jgi:hypothetical protein
MLKIVLEGKMSNGIRISMYKHVKNFKNKELLTLQRTSKKWMNSPILHVSPNKHHCIPIDVFNWNICT